MTRRVWAAADGIPFVDTHAAPGVLVTTSGERFTTEQATIWDALEPDESAGGAA